MCAQRTKHGNMNLGLHVKNIGAQTLWCLFALLIAVLTIIFLGRTPPFAGRASVVEAQIDSVARGVPWLLGKQCVDLRKHET